VLKAEGAGRAAVERKPIVVAPVPVAPVMLDALSFTTKPGSLVKPLSAKYTVSVPAPVEVVVIVVLSRQPGPVTPEQFGELLDPVDMLMLQPLRPVALMFITPVAGLVSLGEKVAQPAHVTAPLSERYSVVPPLIISNSAVAKAMFTEQRASNPAPKRDHPKRRI
jgi:hypothetical protein